MKMFCLVVGSILILLAVMGGMWNTVVSSFTHDPGDALKMQLLTLNLVRIVAMATTGIGLLLIPIASKKMT